MKTIGTLISEKRRAMGISLPALSNETKIKESFILAIERHEWAKLPEFPVVTGFVKNIATALDIDRAEALAFLRRDYQIKKGALAQVTPKQEIKKEFTVGPRLVFSMGLLIVILVIFGYLVYQYSRFMSPPVLTVFDPKEGQMVRGSSLTVNGKTSDGVTLKVNNQPVIVGDDGTWSAEIVITPESTEIEVVATSRAGKVTAVKRTIEFEK